jgi:mannose-6-phosphate isomerase-like protein (cupin superfamily)
VSERLEWPEGAIWVIEQSPANAATDPVVIEMRLPDGATAPPPHFHPDGQTETYEVLEGSFEVQRGGSWQEVRAGETASVESGTVHTFRNESGALCVLRNTHQPAHSFERYARRLHAFISERGTERVTPVVVLGVARLWSEHSDTLRPGPLPLRLAFPALAAVSRLARVRIPA